jgi:flavorubredoxin
LSHQDPDIVAAVNGWLMTTDADAYLSQLWVRFVPHFGLDHLVEDRLKPIPDEGMVLNLDGADLLLIPAHFLHSEGNFQVYDPISKILYTGDLGASIGAPYIRVSDFDAHLRFMEGFHRRYMVANRVMKAWAEMVRPLDIEIIAPQHGAYFQGKEMVDRFIKWCAGLQCGVDLITPMFKLPKA